MQFNVRCHEHVINGQSKTLAITDEIELPHPDGANYMTLCLDNDLVDVVISNFRNLLDTCELDTELMTTRREISSTPVNIADFSVDQLAWTTELHSVVAGQTIAPEAEVVALAAKVLNEPGAISDFITKASDALVEKLDAKVAEAWKAVHELSETRDRARLLKLHLPSVKARKALRRRSESYIEFGRGMGDTSATPPDEALDELFAQGVSHAHVEMMSDEHAWFGIKLVNGRYFHGSLTGKNLEIRAQEEPDA